MGDRERGEVHAEGDCGEGDCQGEDRLPEPVYCLHEGVAWSDFLAFCIEKLHIVVYVTESTYVSEPVVLRSCAVYP